MARIDKWLWAARFFKTRSLAVRACELGRVESQGQPVKPAREVRVGDLLKVRTPGGDFEIEVLALSEVRGPASVAQTLYRETEAGREQRLKLAEERRGQSRVHSCACWAAVKTRSQEDFPVSRQGWQLAQRQPPMKLEASTKTTTPSALGGIRVLDFSHALAGPYCTGLISWGAAHRKRLSFATGLILFNPIPNFPSTKPELPSI